MKPIWFIYLFQIKNIIEYKHFYININNTFSSLFVFLYSLVISGTVKSYLQNVVLLDATSQ